MDRDSGEREKSFADSVMTVTTDAASAEVVTEEEKKRTNEIKKPKLSGKLTGVPRSLYKAKFPRMNAPLRINRFSRRVRSRSAPVRLRKRNRRRIVEQHYKIDKENLQLLPGVPVQDYDLKRDAHDFFNLIILIPIIVLNILNWNMEKLIHFKLKKGQGYRDSWHGDFFNSFFYTTLFYYAIDLIWVLAIPKCVKSPTTIIQHHLITMLYIFVPYCYPKLRWSMGVCMLVEINTWFLIARRVFNRQGFPPWTIDLPYFVSVRVKLISICFYISWILIRCIVYPYMLIPYFGIYREMRDKRGGSPYNIMIIAILIHTIFCAFNTKWTLDLINSKLRQWKSKKRKEMKLEAGL